MPAAEPHSSLSFSCCFASCVSYVYVCVVSFRVGALASTQRQRDKEQHMYYVGVDVGTTLRALSLALPVSLSLILPPCCFVFVCRSVRCAVYSDERQGGAVFAASPPPLEQQGIRVYRYREGQYAEQSSGEIWSAVVQCVKVF